MADGWHSRCCRARLLPAQLVLIEIAVLRQTRHSATVIVTLPTHLLVLDAADLHGPMDRKPEFEARIHNAANANLGKRLERTTGDITREEIADNSPASTWQALRQTDHERASYVF
jgi:CRP-like cAMP-binding protein